MPAIMVIGPEGPPVSIITINQAGIGWAVGDAEKVVGPCAIWQVGDATNADRNRPVEKGAWVLAALCRSAHRWGRFCVIDISIKVALKKQADSHQDG